MPENVYYQKCILLNISRMRILESSQMVNRLSSKTGICEKISPRTPILSCAKILIFRKCRKLFSIFLHLRRIVSILFLHVFVKTFKMRLLRKTDFSQMFCGFCCTISQRAYKRVWSLHLCHRQHPSPLQCSKHCKGSFLGRGC